mmetsp:Transcript_147790/g.275447  ORF Transcript_147790/g.275447 Transcript_147790/m.275447 type:complete len:383 (+) Transcript_147790:301-1449(+)
MKSLEVPTTNLLLLPVPSLLDVAKAVPSDGEHQHLDGAQDLLGAPRGLQVWVLVKEEDAVPGVREMIGAKALIGAKVPTGAKAVIGAKAMIGAKALAGEKEMAGMQALPGAKALTGERVSGVKVPTGAKVATGAKVLIGARAIGARVLRVTGVVEPGALTKDGPRHPAGRPAGKANRQANPPEEKILTGERAAGEMIAAMANPRAREVEAQHRTIGKAAGLLRMVEQRLLVHLSMVRRQIGTAQSQQANRAGVREQVVGRNPLGVRRELAEQLKLVLKLVGVHKIDGIQALGPQSQLVQVHGITAKAARRLTRTGKERWRLVRTGRRVRTQDGTSQHRPVVQTIGTNLLPGQHHLKIRLHGRHHLNNPGEGPVHASPHAPAV